MCDTWLNSSVKLKLMSHGQLPNLKRAKVRLDLNKIVYFASQHEELKGKTEAV
jgi:hypothetical protein